MNELRSEVLIDELRVASRVYPDIRIGEPVRSPDGVTRVPFFSGRSFLWNLIELREDLSPFHFTVVQTAPDRSVWGQVIAKLIDRGHAVETPYSYKNRRVQEAVPVLLASGALKRFLEDPIEIIATSEPTTESTPAQKKPQPAGKVTGDAFQVFFIDDLGDATALSDPIATREEAVQWEERYWEDYFKRNPGTVLYFCSSEVRSIFIPEDDAA